MARIVRWDPFHELRQMMNTPFDVDWEDDFGMNLAVDVSQDDDNVYVEADLPAIDPEEVDITVTADQVTIEAERKEEVEEKDEGRNYLRRERRYGRVARTLALPCEVVGEDATADFEDGKLTLTLPKVEEVRPKQIKVSASKKEK